MTTMADTVESQNELVRREFTRQLPNFVQADSFFARAAESTLEWLQPLDRDQLVLDVACGAAHACEVAAPHVRQVVGIDLTPALLGAGAERLRERGTTNVLLQEGDAAAMPVLDESFDLVFCRFAVHHFPDPRRQLGEMARVCRRGGRVAIWDMVAPDAAMRDDFDELHRLLDPSHARALPAEELIELTDSLVGPITRADGARISTPFSVERLMNEGSARAAVLDALQRELDGGGATGFDPTLDEHGHVQGTFRSLVVHATRR
jgi:ubiquinone/menaquinone biosynthesis C-methylase UbiE